MVDVVLMNQLLRAVPAGRAWCWSATWTSCRPSAGTVLADVIASGVWRWCG